MPDPNLDPLSQVHDCLWEMLEADEAWCALVPVGNRIKYAGKGVSPRKDQQLSPGDRPEVQIRAASVTPYMNFDSSNTKITARFEIQIATGEQGFDASLFPVLWETIRALHAYRDHLNALTWRDVPLVKRTQAQTGAIGVGQGDADRGMLWWSILWAVEIDMYVPAVLMIPDLSTT